MTERRNLPNEWAELFPFRDTQVFAVATELKNSLTKNFLRVNITHDSEKNYYIYELPGVKKEDISVTIQGRFLTVSAEKKSAFITHERGEINYGEYKRKLELPYFVVSTEISAKYKDGVLTLTFPKRVHNTENITVRVD